MPLDVLGCTRATLMRSTSFGLAWKGGVISEKLIVMGVDYCNY